jgi:hypothetical protein
MGEMGGVIEIIVIVFGVILYPISKQSFILKATSELFKARTSDNLLFEKSKNSIVFEDMVDEIIHNEISKH